MSVKFKKTLSGSGIVITTQLYDVVLFDFSDPTYYKLELDKAITEEWLEDTGALGQPDDSVSMVVYRRSVENSPEFDGRFFAKVSRDIYINDYIVTQAANSILTEQEEVASLPFYYFADNDSPYNSDDTTTTVGSNGKTNTKDEWDDLLKPTSASTPEEFWFIDSAYYHGTYTSEKYSE